MRMKRFSGSLVIFLSSILLLFELHCALFLHDVNGNKIYSSSKIPSPSSELKLSTQRKLTSLKMQKDVTRVNRGFQILERAGGIIPQGNLVKTAKFGWKTIWKTFMSELAPQSKDGSYVRPTYGFQDKISYDSRKFPVEKGRYHVYTGNACPWCHRVLLVIALCGLEEYVSSSSLCDDPEKASRGGWAFDDTHPDPVFGKRDLREVYDLCSPGFTGRCTAPLLVDKKTRQIISNESQDIVRMLNAIRVEDRADGFPDIDLYPQHLQKEIDRLNDKIYTQLNNGVYRSGFATTQVAYDEAVAGVFECLEDLEEILQTNRFLLGDRITEADLRLFPTVIRFDLAYHTLFKCSKRRISDFPNLSNWMKVLYRIPGISQTIDIDDCRRSYFSQLFPLNPSGIVPTGPTADDLGLLDGEQTLPHDAMFYYCHGH